MIDTFIQVYLPYVLSAITITQIVMAGNKHKNAWALGLINQAFWLLWIIWTQNWGFMPMNAAIWVVYIRNHIKWNRV